MEISFGSTLGPLFEFCAFLKNEKEKLLSGTFNVKKCWLMLPIIFASEAYYPENQLTSHDIIFFKYTGMAK